MKIRKNTYLLGFVIVVALLAVQVAERIMGFTFDQASTLSLYLTALVGVALIVRISWPLTPLRTALLVSVMCILIAGCLVFPSFFSLERPTVTMALFLVVCGAATLTLFHILYERLNRPHDEGEDGDRLSYFVWWLEKSYDRRHRKR